MQQIVNINQVRGNKNNPRVIKDERFKKLIESIKFFPEMLWKRNLVVESNEKGFTVLGVFKTDEKCRNEFLSLLK